MNGPFFVCCRNPECDAFVEVASKEQQASLNGRWACQNDQNAPSTQARTADTLRAFGNIGTAVRRSEGGDPFPLRPTEHRLLSLVIYAFEKGHEQGMASAYRAMQQTEGVAR